MATADQQNVVLIPVDELEHAFLSVAVPGFTGSITVDIHLLESAGQEVELTVSRKQSQLVTGAFIRRESYPVMPSPERVQRVKRAMLDISPRLAIRCNVLRLTAHFMDGDLRNYEMEDQLQAVPQKQQKQQVGA